MTLVTLMNGEFEKDFELYIDGVLGFLSRCFKKNLFLNNFKILF